jgi:hypothetical protein
LGTLQRHRHSKILWLAPGLEGGQRQWRLKGDNQKHLADPDDEAHIFFCVSLCDLRLISASSAVKGFRGS